MTRMRYERQTRGWTQRDVAKRAGLNIGNYILIENGRLTPTEDQLDRLGNVFMISPASVLLKQVSIVMPEIDDEPIAATR